MRILPHVRWLIIMNAAVLFITTTLCVVCSKAMTTASEPPAFLNCRTVVIDAGHGGIDTGATSCTGVYESNINLEIALILNDLFHLIGIPTKMIRTTDCSVYTQGNTIAAQKVSDLKNRVQFINNTPNSVFISIHQNYYSLSQYAGAQAFYNADKRSKELAEFMQKTIIDTINPGSRRIAKRGADIYLLEHVLRPGILLECGFLSNDREEGLLRDPHYQKKLCCVVVSVYANYLKDSMLS